MNSENITMSIARGRKLFTNRNPFWKSRTFAYSILFCFMLVWHITLGIGFGDDVYFSTPFQDGFSLDRLIDFLSLRYSSWSSRLFIETALISIVRYPFLWKICNAAVLTLIALCIDLLLNSSNSRIITWVLCAFSFVFPLNMYNEAGWVATTMNYPWPLAAGLIALLPFKKLIFRQKIHSWEYFLSIPLILFAANQEQMCLLLIAITTGILFQLYVMRYDKKAYFYPFVQMILLLLSLLFILTCPGNSARFEQEILTHFPDYGNLSFLNKLEIGFSSTGFTLLMQPEWLMPQNLVFTVFCFLLFILIISQKRHPIILWISVIPFFCCLFFNVLHEFFTPYFAHVVQLRDALTKTGTNIRMTSPHTLFPDLILAVVFGCIVISLYFAFQKKKLFIPVLLLLLIGLGSRFMLAFSPTVWASGERTSMFLLYILISISVLLIQQIHDSDSNKKYFLSPILHTSIATFILFSLEHIL